MHLNDQELNLFMEKLAISIKQKSPTAQIVIGPVGSLFVDGLDIDLIVNFSDYKNTNEDGKDFIIDITASDIVKFNTKLKELERDFDWNEVKTQILPRIIRTKDIKMRIPSLAIGNDLSVIYQINDADHMVSITTKYCQDTKLDIYELDEIARKNLTKREIEFTKIKPHEGFGAGLKVKTDKVFTASHLLRNDLWYRVTDIFADNKFFTIAPNQKTLYLFTVYSKSFATRMQAKALSLFEGNQPDSLSPYPFIITRDGFSPTKPETCNSGFDIITFDDP